MKKTEMVMWAIEDADGIIVDARAKDLLLYPTKREAINSQLMGWGDRVVKVRVTVEEVKK
jgi:hypothetical protein